MSKTSIELEEPYSSKWKRGYLNTNTEGRKTLSLYNSHKDRTSTQYARYLMSIKLGRFLDKEEHIDHKDNNKKNDDINNLQILSLKENNRKASYKPPIICICPICGIQFESTKKKIGTKTSSTKCCSVECGYKQMSITQKKNRASKK
jgi:hypothetical protein